MQVGDRVRSLTYPSDTDLVGTIHHKATEDDINMDVVKAGLYPMADWMVQWDAGQSVIVDTMFVDRITPEHEDELEVVTDA